MKKTILLLLFAFTCVSFSQLQTPPAETGTVKKANRRMSSEEFLKDEQWKVEHMKKAYPHYFQQKALQKTTSWNFTVGTTKKWWTYNYVTKQYDLRSSTCRKVGTNSYIFVEDSVWNSRVTQAAVDSVDIAFNVRTPNTPTKGIYQVETETFGNCPNIDGDPKVIIFIVDIKDGATTGGYIAGFFHSINEYKNVDLKDEGYAPTSNECEIYYLDANPAVLTTSAGISNAMATTAHEFQHMIHYYYTDLYSRPQLTFVNEALSQLAPYICGYPLDDQSGYLDESNIYLFTWRSSSDLVLNDYARAQRFMMYLWEQCGTSVVRNIVQSQFAGLAGIKDAFSKATPAIDFELFMQNWFTANIVGDKAVNPAYGYTAPDLTYASPSPKYNPNIANQKDTIQSLGVKYITYTLGSNLNFSVGAASDKIKVKVVKVGTTIEVGDVPLNTSYAIPGYGSTYETVSLALMNTDTTNSIPVVLNSTGTGPSGVELAYTTEEPTGVFFIADGDTLGVGFDGVSGAKIDSVRIALRRAGPTVKSLSGKVSYLNDYNSFLGSTTASAFLGTLANFTATSQLTANPPSPYPIPWTNWCTLAFNPPLDGEKAFVVGWVQKGNYSGDTTTQSIMCNNSTTSSFNNSFIRTSGKWVYYTDLNSQVYNFLVRAYVSFNSSTGTKEVVELTPKQFNVQQNYPNPFNPSTVISYAIPKDGTVKITVYNTLGKEVAKLVNGFEKAGEHKVHFTGNNLSSGVYFYRVESGDYVKTLRMVLLK